MTPISGTVGFVTTASASHSLFEETFVFGRLEKNLVMDCCDPATARFQFLNSSLSKMGFLQQCNAEVAEDLNKRIDQSQGTLTNVGLAQSEAGGVVPIKAKVAQILFQANQRLFLRQRG